MKLIFSFSIRSWSILDFYVYQRLSVFSLLLFQDINDNAPSFAPDVYTEEISELTRGGNI